MALSRFKATLAKKKGEGERQRILYVEDDDNVWSVTSFALREDYELERARNAAEAFAALRRTKFDIVLCDIQLKGSDLDGIAITQVLRNRYADDTPYRAPQLNVDSPVIFVTAFQDRYSKSQLLAAGGDDVIYKPVDFTRLSLAISRLMLKGI